MPPVILEGSFCLTLLTFLLTYLAIALVLSWALYMCVWVWQNGQDCTCCSSCTWPCSRPQTAIAVWPFAVLVPGWEVLWTEWVPPKLGMPPFHRVWQGPGIPHQPHQLSLVSLWSNVSSFLRKWSRPFPDLVREVSKVAHTEEKVINSENKRRSNLICSDLFCWWSH